MGAIIQNTYTNINMGQNKLKGIAIIDIWKYGHVMEWISLLINIYTYDLIFIYFI